MEKEKEKEKGNDEGWSGRGKRNEGEVIFLMGRRLLFWR